MHQNRTIAVVLSFLFLFTACIEEYDPGDIYDHEANLSVSGWITDLPGKQVISLSLSTPITISIPKTLSGCHVEVLDDAGNIFVYNEGSPGKYEHTFLDGEVQIGRSYKLRIITSEGETYESDYEKILPGPPVSGLRYEKTSRDTREIGVEVPGLQFYTDFNAEGDYAEFFKIDVWETFEFHTMFKEIYIMRFGEISRLSPDSINSICYLTEKVPDINLITTRTLTENKIPDFPLHFVDNQSQRLLYGYSPEIRLLSLSEPAYNYWENQKKILEESGGLFETQPPAVTGNIFNVNDPEEKVLGYFGASSITTTRIFVKGGIIDEFNIEPYCNPSPLSSYTLIQLSRNRNRIAYMIYYPDMNGVLVLHLVKQDCYDCTVYPLSTIEKPEFWNGED